jgi:hypothetical protein
MPIPLAEVRVRVHAHVRDESAADLLVRVSGSRSLESNMLCCVKDIV